MIADLWQPKLKAPPHRCTMPATDTQVATAPDLNMVPEANATMHGAHCPVPDAGCLVLDTW
eukprot:8261064-Alexandrium_andersonii.AAC.1